MLVCLVVCTPRLELDGGLEGRILEQFEHFDGARYWGSLNKLKGNLVWKEKKQDLGLVDVIRVVGLEGERQAMDEHQAEREKVELFKEGGTR